MYTEKVMDHFKNPRNVGEIEDASGVGTVGNPKCGDIMQIYLDVDDNEIIRDVKFKTFGCGAAVATSSMATEMIKGQEYRRGAETHQRGRSGGAGRSAAAEDPLLRAGGRSG
jgi:nitrogen fixation NifU-like protein